MSREAVVKAVEIVGGQTALARKIGTGQATVWKWLHRGKRIQAEYVLAVERATDGVVSRHELRPDLYPREAA